jgi:CubicO group peptidase (beta-lactamase class C family)
MKKFFFALVLALLTFTWAAYSQNECQNDQLLTTLDEYIQQVKEGWEIPGMAVSVIKDGKMVFSKGYGIKEMGSNAPVESSSIFQIGSVSKSFTAAVMASVVDEGLVSWDDTVKNILPDFRWGDEYVENNMQVKDLMTHKTGIGGQVGTYIPNVGYDRDDVYQMMGLIKPKYQFRHTYAYNNITFIIAEKVIEKVTGKTWEENIRTRIFEPLGMTSSSVNGYGSEVENGFMDAGDRACVPHEFYYVPDKMHVAPLYGDERALWWETVIGPAGSVNSTVEDMAKYAQFHLDLGKVGDKQVISERQMKYLHKGQTIVSQSDDYIRLYGHCWFVEQNDRYRLLFHTGTTWGFTAICAFVPELDLGLVVLCNSEVPSDPRYAIMRKTVDLYLGDGVERDYNAEYLADWWESERKDQAEKEKNQKPVEVIPAPNPKAITGHYHKGPLFGCAEVEYEDGKLYIKVGKKGWKRELTHVNGLEYSFRSDGYAFPVKFTMDKKGKEAVKLEIDFHNGDGNDFGPWEKEHDHH